MAAWFLIQKRKGSEKIRTLRRGMKITHKATPKGTYWGDVDNPKDKAKDKAKGEAQRVLEDIRRKQTEVQTFQQNTRNSLQQRVKTFHDLMFEEISKISVDVSKRKGATILIDKSGMTLNGVSNIVYSDAAYDITDEVLKEINKDRPAPTAAPAAAPAPAAAAPAESGNDSPKITLPGVTPAKRP